MFEDLYAKNKGLNVQVIDYIWTMRKTEQNELIHNPMCELFPTEVY